MVARAAEERRRHCGLEKYAALVCLRTLGSHHLVIRHDYPKQKRRQLGASSVQLSFLHHP